MACRKRTAGHIYTRTADASVGAMVFAVSGELSDIVAVKQKRRPRHEEQGRRYSEPSDLSCGSCCNGGDMIAISQPLMAQTTGK